MEFKSGDIVKIKTYDDKGHFKGYSHNQGIFVKYDITPPYCFIQFCSTKPEGNVCRVDDVALA